MKKQEELTILKRKFKQIAKRGYVKDSLNNKAGITNTFYHLLNKDIKKDFKNTMIRIKDAAINKSIFLFKLTPIGKDENQIKRIRDRYGYAESDENKKKIFEATINGGASTFVNGKLFRLKVDYLKEKLFLYVLEKDFSLIDDKTYWLFSDLEKKYNKIPKYLFLIKAWKKEENQIMYYKYYDFYIYEKISFLEFLELIENGFIQVNFSILLYKKGSKIGEIDDKGTNFEMEKYDFEKMYKKINLKKEN